jgi:hypothetical protein
VLTALLVAAILIRNRSLSSVRQLSPGVFTFLVLAVLLAALFGIRSLRVTLLPLLGIEFYRVVHFNPLTTGRDFIHPPGHSVIYYVGYYPGTPVTWWFLSTFALFFFGAVAARNMWRQRGLDPRNLFLFVCAALQAVFTFAARGSVDQHVIYDPMLAAGVLVGIACLPKTKTKLFSDWLCCSRNPERGSASAFDDPGVAKYSCIREH